MLARPLMRGVMPLLRACKDQATRRLVLNTIRSTSTQAVKKSSVFEAHDTFVRRHIGPSSNDEMSQMLKALGYPSLDALIADAVPAKIRSPNALKLAASRGESETLQEFKQIMSQNQIYKSFIGAGYNDVITPPIILRNILENPGWYTPYTPYQAEIAQGRLEMLLNFQTMCTDLTGLPVANASLLDEATACAEAMNMCLNIVNKNEKIAFLVADNVHPQTIDVIKTRADGINAKIRVVPISTFAAELAKGDVFGTLVQYPTTTGEAVSYAELTKTVHAAGAKIVVAADLLSLTVLQPPGEWGADIVCGSAQRFGVPMGFGGPHAAYFTCQEAHKRKLPGRVIGVSRDSRGKPALRMAMQTREQHIRRDKATSNICTAQALLANIAAAYGIYHGPQGLKQIAEKIHGAAKVFATGASEMGYKVIFNSFFDTVAIETKSQAETDAIVFALDKRRINIRTYETTQVSVAFDETVSAADVNNLLAGFAEARDVKSFRSAEAIADSIDTSVPKELARTSAYMTHPVFNKYHAEHEMLRYLFSLQSKDLSLQTAMIPLGSCTMKLNATSEMIPVTWPEVGGMHPFAPSSQTKGYQTMIKQLENWLSEITGFDACSLQPNAGSQGEYAGLLAIVGHHRANKQGHRNICLIPTSAHGTNPASAVMAGMKVVVTGCDAKGNIDFADLKAKALENKDNLAALMITYPSTHGVFEENIKDVISFIHECGGQVYMDGANMNAQVGLMSPGALGADVCHLNLHKTFCIPHGGGGPGMGPICVKSHLAPHLPSHVFTESTNTMGAVSAAPYSSASILPISWMYIRMMGGEGLTHATKMAIINANYMAARLRGHFDILYTGNKGLVAHEFIVDLRPFKASAGISEEDVAKRLQDFNFHAPTMSWPVPGTLMIEPTESESLYELDRLCDALIQIRKEIAEVESGKQDKNNNTLKNAPHTADVVLSDSWNRPYPREQAAYPLAYLRTNKFWPSVGRLDNVFGDRNVICTCPPLESYK